MPDSDNSSTTSGEAMSNRVPMFFPDEVSYNCQGCGRCCTGWSIALTEKDWDNVKDVDWQSLSPELKGRELFVHKEEEYKRGETLYPHYSKVKEDGSCPFLIQNRCFIHSTLGEDKKPAECRLLPYTFTVTPDGVYIGVSYTSMAALGNAGKPLSEQEDLLQTMWQAAIGHEWAKLPKEQKTLPEMPPEMVTKVACREFPVSLAPSMPLDWQQYQELEKRLLDCVRSKDHKSILHALIAGSDLLSQARQVFSIKKEFSDLENYKPSADKHLKDLPGFFDHRLLNVLCFKNLEWPEWGRRYLSKQEYSVKSPLSDPTVIKAAVKAVATGKMKALALGEISVNKAIKYKVDTIPEDLKEFLNRYIYLRIFSKTYCGPALGSLSIISGYNNLMSNIISALIYGKACALARGDRTFKLQDFHEAFFFSERETLGMRQLPKESLSIFDTGFSSLGPFRKLMAELVQTFDSL